MCACVVCVHRCVICMRYMCDCVHVFMCGICGVCDVYGGYVRLHVHMCVHEWCTYVCVSTGK